MATFAQENGIGGIASRAREGLSTVAGHGRAALVAVCFGWFGLCSLWLGWCELPLLRLSDRLRGRREDSKDSELRAQRAIHRTTAAYLRFLDAVGMARVHAPAVERLRERPWLVVANHPSLLDTPVLMSLLPQADFIVADDWSRNPFLRHTVRAAGYLHAQNGAVTVRRAIERLRAGRTLVVYPEGSRTPPEGLRRFERGAAHIALRGGRDILPVVIRVRPRALMKGQALADFPPTRPVWEVEVGDPIRPQDHRAPGESTASAARRITAVLQEHFEKRWDRGSG